MLDAHPALVHATRASLSILQAQGYVRLPNGDYHYIEARPGPGWHSHGSYSTRPHGLHMGRLMRPVLHKHRWALSDHSLTKQDHPPDQLGLHFDALVVALCLWAWLDAAVGLLHFELPFEGPEERPSRRTIQRWLGRAIPHGLLLQQFVREIVLVNCEPRPLEDLFPRGLAPPLSLSRRRWSQPEGTEHLWRALTLLLQGSVALDVRTASLLAEVLRRWTRQTPAAQKN